MPAQKKSTAQRVLAITEENKWQPEFREALSLIRACQEAYVLGPHILAYPMLTMYRRITSQISGEGLRGGRSVHVDLYVCMCIGLSGLSSRPTVDRTSLSCAWLASWLDHESANKCSKSILSAGWLGPREVQASPTLPEEFPSIPQASPSLPEAFPSIPQASPSFPSFPSFPREAERGKNKPPQASPSLPEAFAKHSPSLPKPPRSPERSKLRRPGFLLVVVWFQGNSQNQDLLGLM